MLLHDGGEGAHGWEDGGGWCVPVILLSTHWPLYCLPPGMYTVPLSPFLSAGSGPIEGALATISADPIFGHSCTETKAGGRSWNLLRADGGCADAVPRALLYSRDVRYAPTDGGATDSGARPGPGLTTPRAKTMRSVR